jgi:hypothetical protein
MAIGLPADLFGGFSEQLVASWRARAMASHPSDFAADPEPMRLTLLAALAWSRTAEITDALVDLQFKERHQGGAEGRAGDVRRGQEGPR